MRDMRDDVRQELLRLENLVTGQRKKTLKIEAIANAQHDVLQEYGRSAMYIDTLSTRKSVHCSCSRRTTTLSARRSGSRVPVVQRDGRRPTD